MVKTFFMSMLSNTIWACMSGVYMREMFVYLSIIYSWYMFMAHSLDYETRRSVIISLYVITCFILLSFTYLDKKNVIKFRQRQGKSLFTHLIILMSLQDRWFQTITIFSIFKLKEPCILICHALLQCRFYHHTNSFLHWR